ncbi:MAG: hypothetical protein WCW27_03260 [Patescibacteria group bacterium]|jgi:thiamine transport system permease protein
MATVILSKLWFSTWESALTVVLSLLIGGGLALLEHAWKQSPPRYFTLFMVLPIFMPTAIVAIGFVALWGNAGYVNTLLSWFNLPAVHLLYTPYIIIIGHLFYNVPLAYLAIHLRLRLLHSYLTEAAVSLGSSTWQTFCVAVWPRLRSTVLGISVMIFLYSFMSFALPLILGGIRYQTLEVYIYTLVTQQFNLTSALQLSAGQWLGLTLLILIGWRNNATTSESRLHLAEPTVSYKIWCLRLMRFSLIFFIITPLIALFINGFGQNHYAALARTQFWSAWFRTLSITLLVMAITILTSLSVLLLKKTKLTKIIVMLLAVSPVMFGALALWLIGKSILALTMAYILLLLPLVSYLLLTSWQARPPHFIETLQILGASQWQRILATLRLLAPAIFKSFALGLAFVFGDIALATLLAPYREPLVMSLSYGLSGSYRFHAASTGMSLVLLTIIFGILIIMLLGKRYEHS